MRRLKTASRGDAGILREHANKRCSPLFACSHVRVFVRNCGVRSSPNGRNTGFPAPRHYRITPIPLRKIRNFVADKIRYPYTYISIYTYFYGVMSLQRYDLIAPNGFYIIGNSVCRLTALHPLQGAFTHVMCVMKCNRKCKVWAESAFCILGRMNPALRTREHANKGCSPLFACSPMFAQNPALASGSGFKPPHSRL